MRNQSIIVSLADLLILFLYGGSLYYTDQFIYPIEMSILLVASGFLAFTLGSLGPSPEEVFEWMLFFCLGILTAALSPQIVSYYQTGQYNLDSLWQTCVQTFPYILSLISPWALALPIGLFVHKITRRNYYRHARFF